MRDTIMHVRWCLLNISQSKTKKKIGPVFSTSINPLQTRKIVLEFCSHFLI